MPMLTAVRGATTADNEVGSIHARALELFQELLAVNELNTENIVYVQIQRTPDLDAAYPATGLRNVYPELPIIGGIEHPIADYDRYMIRVLLLLDIPCAHGDYKGLYLHGAMQLKERIAQEC